MKKEKRTGAAQTDSPSFAGVHLYTDGSHVKLSMLCEYATVCCYVFGVLLLLRSMTTLPPYTLEMQASLSLLSTLPFTAILGGFLFPAAFVLLFHLKKHAFLWRMVTAGAFLVIIILFFPSLITGIQLMQITFADRFNQATGFSLPYWSFSYLTMNEAYYGILLFYLIFSALLSFASAWIVSKLKRFWPFLLLAVPFMAGTYYLVDETLDSAFFLLVLSIVGAAASAMYRMPRTKNRKKESALTARGPSSAPFALLSCAAAAMLIFVQVCPRESYTRPEAFRKLTRDPGAFFEDMLDIFSDDAAGGLSGGELGNVDRVVYKEEDHLLVSGGLLSSFDTFLLKGYTGFQYDGHSFRAPHIKELDELERELISYDSDSTLFDLLQPTTSATQYVFESSLSVTPLTIKNVGASDRYVYLPYRLHGVTGSSRALTRSEANQDIGAKRAGYFSGDSYTVYAQLLSRNNALDYLSASDGRKLEELPDMFVTTEEYGTLTKRYTEIAQKYYTQLPDDGRYDWLKPYFEDKDSLSEIFGAVRSIVQTDTSYTLSPGRTPGNKDFVNYFLQESRRGYCSHYAASAVILFRIAGIPARYAEGYTVKPEDLSGRTVTVKDSNAHAWAEIYVEGYGWIPVDFTPTDQTEPETGGQTSDRVSSEDSSEPEDSSIPESSEISEEAPQSSNDGSSSSGSAGTPDTAKLDGGALFRGLLILLLLLLTGGLLAGVFHLRTWVQRKRREKRQLMRTTKDVCGVYRDCLNLLRFCGTAIRPDETEADFARRVDERYPFANITFEQVTRTAERARFSNEPPPIQMCGEITFYYRILRRRILKDLHGMKKLYFLWFRAL